MSEQLKSWRVISDNPYQPRTVDDPEHIEKLARSIAADGLLQKPTARPFGKNGAGIVQLAFGHSRRKAFEWLREHWQAEGLTDRYSGYTVMPVEVAELSDEEMYRHAVAENVQRKDLAPTELSKALKRYMDEFKASSKQAAELFGMNDATVRGMVRLLELPQEAQTALDEGKITQGTARTLLSMQKIASQEKIVETVKKIEKNQDRSLPDEVIEHEINRFEHTIELWDDQRRDGKPRAGYHGWLLDMKNFPNKLLPAMTEEAVGTYEKQIEHLAEPPACSVCPFYTKIRGTHYCGLKICHTRKTVAWQRYLIEQASKQLGIAIYTEEDGPFAVLKGYETPHKNLFAKRHKGLRLIPKSRTPHDSQWGFDGVDDNSMHVVATGEALSKMGTVKTKGGKKSDAEKAEMRRMRVYRMHRKEFLWEFTAVAKVIFDGVPVEAVKEIKRWKFVGVDDAIPDEWLKGKRATAQTEADSECRELIWRMIHDTCSHYHRQSMAGILKNLQMSAKNWGLKIPARITRLAEQIDAEIEAAGQGVSVATPHATKKAKA